MFLEIITPHGWEAEHGRLCYSSLHTHSHKTRRSSFLSSSLSEQRVCVSAHITCILLRRGSGFEPGVLSPAAAKPLSSRLLPPESNILLGKDSIQRQVRADVTLSGNYLL